MNRVKPAGGRPRDKVWKHVVELEDGKWKCKYCERVYAGSASRIRNHLSGLGNDIAACKGVPREIREEVSRLQPQKKRRRQSEEDNEVGNNVGGQDTVGNTSSRAVAIDSITPPTQVVSASARIAPLQVQDPSPSSFRADKRLSDLNSEFHTLHTENVNEWFPSSSNNHLANARTSDAAREDDDVDSNHHMNDATSAAPLGEEPAKKTGKPNVDALAVGVASVSITKSATVGVASVSSNDLVLFGTRSKEEYVTDAFIKFLICYNSSSAISDFNSDPYFRDCLEMGHKYGVASSLLLGGSLVVEKSMLNIKEEVRQYMLMVTESWKTTSCTCIMYYLKEGKQKRISSTEKARCVYGFYCPKGFIFVEGPDPNIDYDRFKNALRLHSPRLDISDLTSEIYHYSNVYHDDDVEKYCICEFNNDSREPIEESISHICFQETIQKICIKVCSRSEWAQDLINKAIGIHEECKWYEELLTKYGMRFKCEKNIKPTEASGLSNFFSIMLLERDLKKKEIIQDESDVEEILHVEKILADSKLWDDGRKLERVLNLILKIPVVMDTLVPTAGYLGMAIDVVKEKISRIFEETGEEDDAFVFCLDLDSQINELAFGLNWGVASYLNPVYFLQREQKDPDFHNKVCKAFEDCYPFSEDELYEELKLYGNVFNNRPALIPNIYHPVKLWEKHGHDLPILRKLAIELLSQPVTCMCNQVKKHIYELQGAYDFILKLNVRMMKEFKLLGDDISRPIDINQLLEL